MAAKIKYSLAQVSKANKLNQRSIAQLKLAASNFGWEDSFIKEIANLEWSVESLKKEAKKVRADKRQTQVILDLHDAAKLDLAGLAMMSQL